MSSPQIIPITWDELRPAARHNGFCHDNRLINDVEQLHRHYPSTLEPYVARIAGAGALLIFRGEFHHPTGVAPKVQFVVTLTPAYPNSYPVITIEGPPSGWVIKRHPTVDTQGQCYLASVTNWNPQRSLLTECIDELRRKFEQDWPHERAAGPTAQQTQSPMSGGGGGVTRNATTTTPPPPQGAAAAQQQQQLSSQSQRSMPTQPNYGAPRATATTTSSAAPGEPEREMTPLQAVAVGTIVMGAMAARAVGRAIDSVTGSNISGGGGGGAARSDEEIQRERRARDMEWLEQQKLKNAEAEKHADIDRNFVAMLNGTPRPAGELVALPWGFGLGGRLKTASRVEAPVLVDCGAPRPLPAVTAPTPDEYHKQVVAETTQAQQQAIQRASAEPKPASILGRGLRAVAIGARMTAALASDAKNAIESKVRESSVEHDTRKFAGVFPVEAATERLMVEYHCKTLCGDGTSCTGRLFITNAAVHFSNVLEVSSAAAVPIATTQGRQTSALTLHFSVPFARVVTISKGTSVDHHWLHLVLDDNAVRSFYGISTNVAGKLGQVVSTSLEGTPFDRAYNWMDHMWRAVAPVPHPTYQYADGGATPKAAANPEKSPTAMVTPAEQSCCICMDRPRNIFFQPCGHVCVCSECAAAVRECPLCRTPVAQRFQAFL